MFDRHPFKWPVRVYYEDTDAGGVVYHSNYVKYFERARTELLRSIGVTQHALLEKKIAFVVKHISISFIKAAKLDDSLTVLTSVNEFRRVSLTFKQELLMTNGERLCEATVKVACVDINKMKPLPIPSSITSEIISER